MPGWRLLVTARTTSTLRRLTAPANGVKRSTASRRFGATSEHIVPRRMPIRRANTTTSRSRSSRNSGSGPLSPKTPGRFDRWQRRSSSHAAAFATMTTSQTSRRSRCRSVVTGCERTPRTSRRWSFPPAHRRRLGHNATALLPRRLLDPAKNPERLCGTGILQQPVKDYRPIVETEAGRAAERADVHSGKVDLVTSGTVVFLAQTLVNVLNFAFHFFVSRRVGVVAYGSFNALNSAIIVCATPALILTTVVVKYAAEFRSVEDIPHLRALLEWCAKLFGTLALAVLVLGLLLAPGVAAYLHIGAAEPD